MVTVTSQIKVTSHGVKSFAKKINELLAENPQEQLLAVYPKGRYGCDFSFWGITEVEVEEYKGTLYPIYLKLIRHISETKEVIAAIIALRDVDLIKIEKEKGDSCISVILE